MNQQQWKRLFRTSSPGHYLCSSFPRLICILWLTSVCQCVKNEVNSESSYLFQSSNEKKKISFDEQCEDIDGRLSFARVQRSMNASTKKVFSILLSRWWVQAPIHFIHWNIAMNLRRLIKNFRWISSMSFSLHWIKNTSHSSRTSKRLTRTARLHWESMILIRRRPRRFPAKWMPNNRSRPQPIAPRQCLRHWI